MKTIKIRSIIFLLFIGLTLVNCSSDDDKDPEIKNPGPPTEAQVHQIEVMLVDIILDSGRDFPKFGQTQRRPFKTNGFDEFLEGPNNYIEIKDEPGELTLRLWLDDEGNIIPSPTWQENNPNYCSDGGRYMRSAKKLLEFTVAYEQDFGLSNPDRFAYYVQLQLVDVETGSINQAVEVPPIIDEDNNWVNATLNEAWGQMLERANIGGAIGPCEAEIALTVHFSSEVETLLHDEDGDVTYFEKVEATFGLTFDENRKVYKGTGTLNWTDIRVIPEPVAGINPFENLVGQFHVLELKTPGMEGIDETPIMIMNITATKITPLWKIAWPVLYDYEYDDINGLRYSIKDWDFPDDPSILMRKVNNRTEIYAEDGDNSTITEKTTIEIHRQR